MPTKQVKYISEYNKEKYKTYLLRVKKSDTKVIEKLDNATNRNQYVHDLIVSDINPTVLTIKQIKDRIKPIMLMHKIREVYLFGSYARGEANKNSDVDIYCDKGDIVSLYDEVDLIEELEKALDKKVDVVTIGSEMNEFFKQQLDEDKIRIL